MAVYTRVQKYLTPPPKKKRKARKIMVPQRNWLRNYCHLEKSFFNAKQVERMGDKHIFLHDSKRTTNFVAVLLFFAPFFFFLGGG
jgi:hypothetical protein